MNKCIRIPPPTHLQGETVDVPTGVGILYLFCFDQPAANNPHFAKEINEAKYGAKPGRVQGNAAAMFLNFEIIDRNVGYDIHCIYWEDLDGPYDQAFVVGPFCQDDAESMACLEEVFGKFIEHGVVEYTMLASP